MSKTPRDFTPLNVAVLTVSGRRTAADDTSGDLVAGRLTGAGHKVAARAIVPEDLDRLREQIKRWVDDPAVDVIISSGGTGLTRHDCLPEAVAPLVDTPIPGFGELFRWLSFEDIGSSTIQSRAAAGIAAGTVIFMLPGSTGACTLAMDRIILSQLDARQRPCNIVELLPRTRKA